MAAQKTTNEQLEKKKTKKLFFIMIITGSICAALGVGVLVYFFVPKDNDTYILTIPTLTGLDERQLGRYQGVSIEREWVYSSEIERGRVISQEPYAGAKRKVRPDGEYKVKIYVSLGEESGELPDLYGVELMSAAVAVRKLGASVRSVAVYDGGEDGKVVSLSPRAGTKIKAGDTVTLFVSRKRADKPVTVPNFVGLELAEAYRRALSIGLYIADEDVIFLNAAVSEQSVPEGAKVKRGSYISFRVAEKESEREFPPIIRGYEENE